LLNSFCFVVLFFVELILLFVVFGQQLATKIGDLEFMVSALGLQSYIATEVCFKCNANRSSQPFNNLLNMDIFTEYPPETVPSDNPIFTVPGVRLGSIALDVLHLLDQGISSLLLGFVLHAMVFQTPGESKELVLKRLASVWKMLQEYYHELGTKYKLDSLHLESFCDPTARWSNLPHMQKLRSPGAWLQPWQEWLQSLMMAVICMLTGGWHWKLLQGCMLLWRTIASMTTFWIQLHVNLSGFMSPGCMPTGTTWCNIA
jgi:hypothetical protein